MAATFGEIFIKEAMVGIRAISRCIFNRGWRKAQVANVCYAVGMAFSCSLFPPQSAQADTSLCGASERALQQAVEIRGIKPHSKVPCVVHSRSEVATFLRFMISEKLPKNSLEMEGAVYRALGVVPDSYDYPKGIFEAYTREIGGYYDPYKKLFVMVDFLSAELQMPVAVHELTHALQDQRFNLDTFLDPKIGNSDLLLAHAALAEGDATAVMEDYIAKRGTAARAEIQPAASPVEVEPLPQSLQEIVLFPYKQGLTFARRIIKNGGYSAVDKAFERPPKSSREILHPEEYLRGGNQTAPIPAESLERLGPDWKLEYSNAIGEFVVFAMLHSTQPTWTSESCSRGLRRDTVGIFRDRERQRFVSWLSEWDTARDAADFVDCYRDFLRGRYKKEVSSGLVRLSPLKEVKLSQSNERVSVVVRLGE